MALPLNVDIFRMVHADWNMDTFKYDENGRKISATVK